MKSLAIIAAILILFLASGCREDEFIERDFPSLATLEVTDLSIKHGATLNAEIISGNLSDIVEYGFLWSTKLPLDIDHSERVVMLDQIKDRKFSADVTGAFRQGQKYYVTAFLRTGKHLVYGQVIEFRQWYGERATIDYYHPTSGTWDDTIKIVGKNFGYFPAEIRVRFGNVGSVVFYFSDTLLFTTVPAVKNNHMVSLRVSAGWPTATADVAFEYLIPEVFEITPMHGGVLDTISIIGKNLGRKNEYSTVKFNKLDAEIIYASDTLIHAIVPAELNTLTSQIKITSIGFDVQFTETFTLDPPIILSFEPEEITKREELIKIYGKNFSSVVSNNVVRVEGNSAQIIEASNDFLIIKTPIQVIPNYYISTFKEVPITVTTLNQTDQQSIYLKWNSTWTQKNNFPGTARSHAVGFTLDNTGYIGTGLIGPWQEATNDFWKYDPEQDAWEQIASMPGEVRGNSVAFTFNNYAYVGLGRNINGCFADFYKYSPSSNNWERITDFPGTPRHSSACFVINNFAWVGTGYALNYNSSPTANFYIFNPINNTWSQEIDFARATGRAVGLSIGDEGYVYDFNALFKLVSGTWEQLAAPTLNTFYNTAFTISHKLYFGLGENNQGGSTALWGYDPLTQISLNKPFGHRRSGVAVFTINNKAYIVGGTGYLNSVWEFDPTKPEN
jgi:N-acetylneuraminic acid mutarotase